MIKRLLSNASGWLIPALLGITVFAGMQARNYALQLSATETRLARAYDQVEILQAHQQWQREQIDRISAVLAFRDEQVTRDNELVDMMRATAAQLERDDASTRDWADQPVPGAVGEWLREFTEDDDRAGDDGAGRSEASADAPR